MTMIRQRVRRSKIDTSNKIFKFNEWWKHLQPWLPLLASSCPPHLKDTKHHVSGLTKQTKKRTNKQTKKQTNTYRSPNLQLLPCEKNCNRIMIKYNRDKLLKFMYFVKPVFAEDLLKFLSKFVLQWLAKKQL